MSLNVRFNEGLTISGNSKGERGARKLPEREDGRSGDLKKRGMTDLVEHVAVLVEDKRFVGDREIGGEANEQAESIKDRHTTERDVLSEEDVVGTWRFLEQDIEDGLASMELCILQSSLCVLKLWMFALSSCKSGWFSGERKLQVAEVAVGIQVLRVAKAHPFRERKLCEKKVGQGYICVCSSSSESSSLECTVREIFLLDRRPCFNRRKDGSKMFHRTAQRCCVVAQDVVVGGMGFGNFFSREVLQLSSLTQLVYGSASFKQALHIGSLDLL